MIGDEMNIKINSNDTEQDDIVSIYCSISLSSLDEYERYHIIKVERQLFLACEQNNILPAVKRKR